MVYVYDNRDGSKERIRARRKVVVDEIQVEWQRATQECEDRNKHEGWKRFVPMREK